MGNRDEIRRAYQNMQESFNVNVGDQLRILRKADNFELGWESFWTAEMDELVGHIVTVDSFDTNSLLVSYSMKTWSIPFFICEKINVQTHKIILDGKTIEISHKSFENLKSALL